MTQSGCKQARQGLHQVETKQLVVLNQRIETLAREGVQLAIGECDCINLLRVQFERQLVVFGLVDHLIVAHQNACPIQMLGLRRRRKPSSPIQLVMWWVSQELRSGP